MKNTASQKPCRIRTASRLMMGCLLMTTLGYAQAAQTNASTGQFTAGQSVFITFPDAKDESTSVPGGEIVRLRVADGYLIFVQLMRGDVGIVAEGKQALDILRSLTGAYRLSPLDIFEAAGGNRKTAPAALVNDHQKRQSEDGGRSAPLPLISALPAATASVQGESELGLIGGAACVEGAVETFDYFTSWWQSLYHIPGIGALADIGAHGQEGIGIWDLGEANLNLGSTSAGAAVVCFPQESDHFYARITVQEYYGNGIWLDLWSNPYVYDGVAYGYWFKGLVVHKIRVLIRDTRPMEDQVTPIGPFYWAGAY